jgi:hypothetical protein
MRQEARKQDSEFGWAVAEEYKRWAGEDFKSEIAIVIIDCNSAWHITNKSGIKSRIHIIIWRVTSVTRHSM